MRSLFKKSAPSTPTSVPIVFDEVPDLPLPPMPREPVGAGEINLILMVQEYAPVRISQNEKEIEGMKKRIAHLEKENDQLAKLLSTIE